MAWYHRIAANVLGKQFGVDAGTIVTVIGGGLSGAGGRRFNARTVLNAYATSPWFRAVVERVSFAAAVVAWRLFATRPARGSREYRAGRSYVKHAALQGGGSLEIRSKITKQLEANDQLDEITDHPLFDLLNNPNPLLTGLDMRLITFASILVVGEIGWAITRGETLGEPTEIWPVPGHWIQRRPGESGATDYHVNVGGRMVVFSPEEFVLFRNPTLENPYGRGAGMGSSLADELETDEYISKFQSRWFVTHGKPELVFIAKPGKTGKMISEDDLKKAKEDFNSRYANSLQAPGSFWTGGNIEIKELGSKMVDLDLTEQRTWIKDLVHQVLGAPPEIMGVLTSSNRATITQALAILAIVTTVPQLERMRAQLQQQLIPMFDDRLALGYWSPVPEDREFQLKAIRAAPYAVEIREIRKVQGLQDRGEVDAVHMMPLNLIPMPAPKENETFGSGPLGSGDDDDEDEDDTEEITDDDDEKALKARPALRALKPHVKQIDESDIDALVDALQPRAFEVELTPEVEKTIEKWGNRTLTDLGLDPSFNMTNPLTTDYLANFSSTKITSINNTTRAFIREGLRQGVASGESIPELSRRVEAIMGGMKRGRSTMIARTEVNGAANNGTFSAHSVSGLVPRRAWVSTLDDRTRDGTDGVADHLSLDGFEVAIDEEFPGATGATARYPGDFGVAEEDINCFVPETEVRGAFFGGVRSMYSGPIVEIQTAGGRRLRVTPNHPVLTPRGFVAAGELRCGDYVIGYGVNIESPAKRQNIHNPPSRIDQVFGAIGAPGFSASVGVHTKDLHGDAARVHGEVDVVAIDGMLLPHRTAAVANGIREFSLMPTPSSYGAFVSDGPAAHLVGRRDPAARGIPRSSTLQPRRSGVHKRPLQPLRVGTPSEIDASFFESGAETSASNPGLVAELFEGGSSLISLDQIVQVRDGQFCGHVFDLQSTTGWMVANGIITSNCRCTTRGITEDEKSFDKALFVRTYLAETDADNKRLKAATNRAFDLQTEAILSALEALA